MWNFIWNNLIVNPMTNLLLTLYDVLGNNFFLALVAFTAIVRLIMLPLNMRQQRSMMRTQEMQPQIQAIQKKYRDNPQKMQEEFQRIGYNPAESLMGCLPLVLQMPIFFGLYRAIQFTLSTTPQGLFQLSERAYDSVNLTELLPIANSVFWLNLSQPDPLFILPVLVGGTMFLQQKLIAPKKKDDGKKKKNEDPNPAESMQQSMQVTMPLMFGFFALQFPAGLSIYFVVSNIIGIFQGFIMRRNREGLEKERARRPKPKPIEEETVSAEKSTSPSKNGSSKPKKDKEYVPPSKRKQSKRKRQSGK